MAARVAATLELSLDDGHSAVPAALDQVEAFLQAHGAGEQTQFQFRLALDELITNVFTHGGQGQFLPDVDVVVEVDRDHAVCELRDNGVAFNPLELPPADTEAPLDDRPVGGLGVHFVRQIFRDLHYRRQAGRNVLRLRSALADAPEDHEPDQGGRGGPETA
jgi:anti-sigma regulatory factor (Ser/Thr protein kinase)